jgi:hypothetical protein
MILASTTLPATHIVLVNHTLFQGTITPSSYLQTSNPKDHVAVPHMVDCRHTLDNRAEEDDFVISIETHDACAVGFETGNGMVICFWNATSIAHGGESQSEDYEIGGNDSVREVNDPCLEANMTCALLKAILIDWV